MFFRSTKSKYDELKDNENLIFGGVRLISIKCRCGCGLIVYKEKSLGMVIRVVEFSRGGYKIRKIFA